MRRPLLLALLALLAAPVTIVAQAAQATAPEPSLADLAAKVATNETGLNFVWVMVAGFLVMFMQLGFCMVEVGFTRAKNAAHTALMNFMVYALGMFAFWAVGFAIQMGGTNALGGLGSWADAKEFVVSLGGKDWGVFGTKGFFLSGIPADAYAAVFGMFLFQMVFMDTTATIPTGALAERWKFSSFCVLTLFIGGLIYPIYANWTWGGGWLSALGANLGLGHGHVDFAGSSVVHLTGGVIAFVTAKLLGPRRGKYNADGSPNAIPGHNIPMAMFGTFVLCFGWFGFNAGSTLMGTDSRIGVIATNTMLAGMAGSITSMLYMWSRYGKPDPSMLANGALAGLVAITAPCAFVTAPAAVLIGGIAGVLVCIAVFFIERTLRIDDPVGAISVHGVNGAFGVLALGLFADGTYGGGLNGVQGNVTGLFYGDSSQLVAQCVGVATNIVVVGTLTAVAWAITGLLVQGHRVSTADEELGLDLPEVGALAYPDATDLGSAVVISTTAPSVAKARPVTA
jgi:Amt family ammonium transporter